MNFLTDEALERGTYVEKTNILQQNDLPGTITD